MNTDELHPSCYFSLDPERRAAGALGGLSVPTPALAGPRILVAGWNLGIGSSRESTLRGLVEAGVRGILARSCARIFLRNAINAGLPVGLRQEGFPGLDDELELQLDWAEVTFAVSGTARSLRLDPLDAHLRAVLEAGGLVPYLDCLSKLGGLP